MADTPTQTFLLPNADGSGRPVSVEAANIEDAIKAAKDKLAKLPPVDPNPQHVPESEPANEVSLGNPAVTPQEIVTAAPAAPAQPEPTPEPAPTQQPAEEQPTNG